MIVSFISRLFWSRCPSAIRWLVSLIVVFSFDAVLFARCLPHVREKGIKIVPAVAHLDSTTSVIRVIDRVLIVASLPHSFPDSVFVSSMFPVCSSVASELLTSASRYSSFGCVGPNSICNFDSLCSALANELPKLFAVVVVAGHSDCREASEFHPSDVSESSRWSVCLSFFHEDILLRRNEWRKQRFAV